MSGFTDYTEAAFLNHIFTDPTWTPPTTLYVGLASGTESDDAAGGLTEATIGVGSYARVAITAASMAAATGTAPVTKSNSAVVTFPTATADWLSGADATKALLFDDDEAGNCLAVADLAQAKPVLTGDTPSFPIGALAFKMGDPSDSY